MFCRECGKMIQEGNKFCTGCGTKVEPITIKTNVEKVNSTPIAQEEKQVANPVSNVNNNSKNFNQNSTKVTNVKDKYSVGYNILAFFVPIVGLILFLVMKNETPKKAKGIGISALVGYILSVIVSILYTIFVFWLTFTTLESDYDNNKWENYDYEYNEYYDDYQYDFNGNYNI